MSSIWHIVKFASIFRNNEIKLIDSPGVIPLARDDEIRYGLIGAKDSERLKNPELVAYAIIKLFMKASPKFFENFYKILLKQMTVLWLDICNFKIRDFFYLPQKSWTNITQHTFMFLLLRKDCTILNFFLMKTMIVFLLSTQEKSDSIKTPDTKYGQKKKSMACGGLLPKAYFLELKGYLENL